MSTTPERAKGGPIGEWLRGPQVVVAVGADKVRYPLPKGRLVQDDVPFFKAAFTGAFDEAVTNSLELPSEEVEVFDLFVEWLLAGAVPVVPVSAELHHLGYKEVERLGMVEYERAWHQLAHMAHKFCCLELERKVFEVLETYHSLAGIVCHPILLDLDYTHMPDSAPLEAFAMSQFKSLEEAPLEDFSLMLDFLVAKAPRVLAKVALGEQLKRLEAKDADAKKKGKKKKACDDCWGWGSAAH